MKRKGLLIAALLATTGCATWKAGSVRWPAPMTDGYALYQDAQYVSAHDAFDVVARRGGERSQLGQRLRAVLAAICAQHLQQIRGANGHAARGGARGREREPARGADVLQTALAAVRRDGAGTLLHARLEEGVVRLVTYPYWSARRYTVLPVAVKVLGPLAVM